MLKKKKFDHDCLLTVYRSVQSNLFFNRQIRLKHIIVLMQQPAQGN